MSAAKDRPQTKPATDEYRDNYDRIFRKVKLEDQITLPSRIHDGDALGQTLVLDHYEHLVLPPDILDSVSESNSDQG